MRLANKVAIVTGAGAGIGRETGIRFAEEGAKVVLTDISEAGVRAAADQVAQVGGEVIAIAGDISKEADAYRIGELAVTRFGGRDGRAVAAGAGRERDRHRAGFEARHSSHEAARQGLDRQPGIDERRDRAAQIRHL
jgi:NAD(P)-dependent dehydrogenase (short-subunit alcohol dehydrogenase family)